MSKTAELLCELVLKLDTMDKHGRSPGGCRMT